MRTSRSEYKQAVAGSRQGFTLVELLIAVAVLLVLAALTLTALTVASEEDVAEGARSAQSFTEGARDRAIYRKRPVGIRLLLDPNGTTNAAGNPVVATSLQYVGSPSETLKGVFVVDNNVIETVPPGDVGRVLVNDVTAPFEPLWESIRTNRGLISRNFQLPISIVVNPSTGATEQYIVGWDAAVPNTPASTMGRWVLTRPYTGPLNTTVEYELELLPAVLANQQIRELPRDAVINLADSKIPAYWYSTAAQIYTSYMDIMFSPRGAGVGAASGSGMIHLHVCSPEDRERVAVAAGPYFIGKSAATVIGNPRNSDPERLISINPVTGNITIADIPKFVDADQNDIPDANEDGNPMTNFDPYQLAEYGFTAQ